ncbi:isochorismatase family protein [Desulfurispirillum indicum]|uniref:Isochorismatase hydrolase n=1 Tax=Desulfurispirillum indicum (strain ATCC BAA-1389 / DSM 22839 / S5) TaxID=653733 RepID=E6W041_DESIS|nr:isochorismatase family protein [Desulfurispirillum indicum]ADU65167.1 isochorismatase hydrolase [Desulfurispirillum indicum S5]UCZ57059.1 isochorismatase family protein [Desulfurispirillum indicum]
MYHPLDPATTLFMVIDIQGKLAQIMPRRESILKNTSIMIQSCHMLGVPLCVTEQYPAGLGHTDPALLELLREEDPVLEKITFSAYTDEVQQMLEQKRIANVVIAGIETHICVFQTIRSLTGAGFGVYLLQDAAGSRSEENYLSGLDLARQMGAVVTNTESVLFDLLGKAGTGEFKAISKLVK